MVQPGLGHWREFSRNNVKDETMINVYKIARVVAPESTETWTTELDSKTSYTHMLSELNPLELASQIRKAGNVVDHHRRNGLDGALIPWKDQTIRVNWREIGDFVYPDGWFITVVSNIDADLAGLVQQINDDREATEALSLKTFEVVCTRLATEAFSVNVLAPDADAAELAALEMCRDSDMDAEWERGECPTKPVIDHCGLIPDYICAYCENEVLITDGVWDHGGAFDPEMDDIYHDDCLADKENS
jgi:hypothetical protein